MFNPERFTLYLHNATINGSVRLDAGFSSDGEVRLSRTTIADDPDTWPATFLIRGFAYERFGPLTSTSPPNWDAGPRIAWLARQSSFEAGPYEHAARVFREHGCGRSWTSCTACSVTATDRAAQGGRWWHCW